MMYDMTKPETLRDLNDWMEDANTKIEVRPVYMLLGNKRDLVEPGMEMTKGELFGEVHEIPENLQFKISISKSDKQELRGIFTTLAQAIYTKKKNEKEIPELKISERTVLIEEENTSHKQRTNCINC